MCVMILRIRSDLNGETVEVWKYLESQSMLAKGATENTILQTVGVWAMFQQTCGLIY